LELKLETDVLFFPRQHQPYIPLTLEEAIDLDLQSEVYEDDGDDSYEDIDEEPDHHTKPVTKGKGGKAEKPPKGDKEEKPKAKRADKVAQGQQSFEKRPDDGGNNKDDDSSSSDSSDSDDSDGPGGGGPGVGANLAGGPSASDDKGKVEVPKESPDTIVIGLKVYTNKDVGCSVEGKLRVGCKDPKCTLCEPPSIVTIPAAGDEEANLNDAEGEILG